MAKKAVAFRIGNEEFGLFSEEVREIVYAPRLFPVPKAPDYVKGIGNLRGSVLPIVDLKKLLFGEEGSVDEETKVIVLSKGKNDAGIVVDEVKEVLDVDEGKLQRVGVDETVKGVYERSGRLIQFLDLDFLFQVEEVTSLSKGGEVREERVERSEEEEAEILLLLKAGGSDFCLSIEDVREIIDAPEELTEVPGAQDYVLGLYSLRGTVIPVVSMARLMDLPQKEGTRVVVIHVRGVPVGFLVDRAREVYRVPKREIAPPPAGFEDKAFVKGVVKVKEKLVLYIDPQEIVPDGLGEYVESCQGEGEEVVGMGELKMFVNFLVGENTMAFPIEKVAEVVDLSEIVPVPRAPFYVEGIMNLRGDVLPVVSLSKRLDINSESRPERIVVVNTDRGKVGFLVDRVKGIVRVDENLLFPPEEIPNFKEEFLDAVTRLDTGELVLVLNPEKLLGEYLEVEGE